MNCFNSFVLGLDILRIVIRNAGISKTILDNGEELLQHLIKIVKR